MVLVITRAPIVASHASHKSETTLRRRTVSVQAFWNPLKKTDTPYYGVGFRV